GNLPAGAPVWPLRRLDLVLMYLAGDVAQRGRWTRLGPDAEWANTWAERLLAEAGKELAPREAVDNLLALQESRAVVFCAEYQEDIGAVERALASLPNEPNQPGCLSAAD